MFEQKFAFSLVVFLCTCGNFTLIFTVLFDFLDRIFFLNDFPNPFIVHSRPSLLFEPNLFEPNHLTPSRSTKDHAAMESVNSKASANNQAFSFNSRMFIFKKNRLAHRFHQLKLCSFYLFLYSFGILIVTIIRL